MNRRRFLLVLAALALIAIFIPAKIAASWRPVAVGEIAQPNWFGINQVRASARYVTCDGPLASRFDLQSGDLQYVPSENQGIVERGDWRWQVETHGAQNLNLREGDGAPVTYRIPRLTSSYAGRMEAGLVAVSPPLDRVEMVMGRRYTRWKQGSRQVERDFDLPTPPSPFLALSRDGGTLTQAGLYQSWAVSTRDGKLLWKKPRAKIARSQPVAISPYGHYAVYDNKDIVELRTGRTLWSFRLRSTAPTDLAERRAIFAPDETFIALPVAARKLWELYDPRNGKLIGTLPLVPNAQNGAFSPDGATLYSVAAGVLYRQRAR